MTSRHQPELGVLFDVLRANEAVGAMLRRALGPMGLTPTGYAVLSVVDAHGRTTPTEVAETIGAKPSTLTAHLARLVDAGLISRSAGTDGRSADLEVTDEGRATRRNARRQVDRLWRPASRSIDVPQLRALLGEFTDAVSTETARSGLAR